MSRNPVCKKGSGSKPKAPSRPAKPASTVKDRKAKPASAKPTRFVREVRSRLGEIAELIKALLGDFPEAADDISRCGKYLSLVSLIFATLRESPLSSADLKTLTLFILDGKVPGAGGKSKRTASAENSSQGGAGEDSCAAHRGPGLPPRVRQAVRAVYGLDLHDEFAGSEDRGRHAQVE